jgi:outer membrane protein assembly factor BamB
MTQNVMVRACTLLPSLFSLLLAGNWITSGGDPARTGLSDEIGPQTPTIIWENSLSGWFGLPVFISGDKLVTTRFQSIDYAPVVCHDLSTGETLWTRDFPGTNSRSIALGVQDSVVYAMNFQESRHDTIYALSARDGSIIWRGATTVEMSISESVTFCPDGDILVTGSGFRICRLSSADGSIVWSTPRVWPVTGSCDICVHGNRAYAYKGDIGSLYLNSCDLATGTFIDSVRIQDTHPGGPLPQAAPMVGPDGTIYAHKVGDNVTAIRDFGDSLHVLWVHEISGEGEYFSAFSHFAVGPDSTVYVASYGRIQRLDPGTGAAIDSSDVVQDPSGVLFNVRLAIGADGTVYLATGQDAGGLYAFSPSLEQLWFEPIPNVNTSGPAIGAGGVLAVAGAGLTLKVYAGGSAVAERLTPDASRSTLEVTPNPCRGSTILHLATGPLDHSTTLRLFDSSGRLVRHCSLQPGNWSLALDLRGLSTGAYLCRVGTASTRLVKVD